MLRIFAISLFVYYLYTCTFTYIFAIWGYVFVLTCAGDVASRGVSDSCVKLKPSIVTQVGGGGGGEGGTRLTQIRRQIIFKNI